MKFVSFNINGLRARLPQLEAIITILQPDVIGLQETKVHDDMFPLADIRRYGYHVYYHGQKMNSGVALLSKDKPLVVRRGLSTDDDEAKCRLIIADFMTQQGLLTVVNGYFPQGESRHHPVKFIIKQRFYQKIKNYVEQRHQDQSLLLIMGDMNISPTDLDIGIGEDNRQRWLRIGKCSFLPEERDWIARILDCGLVDTYRQENPDHNNDCCYSWFDYRSCGFSKNRGLRIDLLLASRPLAAYVQSTGINYVIRAMAKPSDHAPVWVDFSL